MKPYVYIIVREDLKKEWQLVQACHAALEAGYSFNRPPSTTHLVVLSAKNEWELKEIAEALDYFEIKYEMFNESYYDIGYTAIATEPIEKQTTGILKSLCLFKY